MKRIHTTGSQRARRARETRQRQRQAERTRQIRDASANAHKTRYGGKSAGGRGLATGSLNYVGHGDYSQRIRKSVDKFAINKVERRREVDELQRQLQASLERKRHEAHK